MTKRMLIDASHAEETRVVVLDGNRLEDFDVETANRRQLKGNIYLAKVVRIEPSLQAAFVDYGGGRHGFLAFSEIHPDYYQIPVADRQRLLDMQAEQARAEEEAEDERADASSGPAPVSEPPTDNSEADIREAAVEQAIDEIAGDTLAAEAGAADAERHAPESPEAAGDAAAETFESMVGESKPGRAQPARIDEERITSDEPITNDVIADVAIEEAAADDGLESPSAGLDQFAGEQLPDEVAESEPLVSVPVETPAPETLGGEADGAEEAQERRIPPRFLRNYKLQEVIRRRQIMLVQVVKEERGNKGAALTTYISLAGRYCVLMPNSPRGGGISRKITSPGDRRRLKEIMTELDIPNGMGLIVRTAGANRPKAEIKRDCEYLLRFWDEIRDTTMRSVAPALIYEEASLIKRAIRDVYSRDIDEVVVDGEDGWRAAHDFMRMLMPSHARKVILWNDRRQPLFAKHQVEAQLDAVLLPTVQLRSGGYLVINQTEALVAIDVNSGRSTRERGIEETALRTNLEAAEELARQLRLRDLAGLIVIDFIDMELRKHNGMVERRLKEALKNDRARLQVGHISHFGLLEMSRQRLRPSVAETNFAICPNCGGTGHVRSTESAAIHVLRAIEEEAASRRASEIRIHVAGPIAMYVLNHKRERLHAIEQNYGLHVMFEADDALIAPELRIERLRAPLPIEVPAPVTPEVGSIPPAAAELDDAEIAEESAAEPAEAEDSQPAAEDERQMDEGERRRRRRRRRRRPAHRGDSAPVPEGAEQPEVVPADARESAYAEAHAPAAAPNAGPELPETTPGEIPERGATGGGEAPPRRRPHRGGRRRTEPRDAEPAQAVAEVPPPYSGPTPADPYAGAFQIFDVMEEAEQMPPQPAPVYAAPPPFPERPETSLQPAMAAPEPPAAAEPEPVPEPTNSAAEPAAAEPAIEETAPPPPAPVVTPFVIGADAPVAEKKRGWWRR